MVEDLAPEFMRNCIQIKTRYRHDFYIISTIKSNLIPETQCSFLRKSFLVDKHGTSKATLCHLCVKNPDLLVNELRLGRREN